MNEKLAKIFEDEKVKYFANMLKFGIKEEDIQKLLDLSDNDYNTIYPLAIKLAN